MLLLGLQSPASWLGSGSGATNRLSTPDVRASQPTHSPSGEICTLAASAFAKSAVRGTECSIIPSLELKPLMYQIHIKTALVPPREQLCNRSCSNKHTHLWWLANLKSCTHRRGNLAGGCISRYVLRPADLASQRVGRALRDRVLDTHTLMVPEKGAQA